MFPRLIVLICGLWLGAVVPPGSAAAGPEAGVVSAASGETWLVRESFMSSPVRRSAGVRAGDRLMTGVDGRIELRLADSAAISIGPGSEFRIDDYQFDERRQRSFFSLVRGTMRQVSGQIGKRNHDDYRLTTPTGVLAIRGTEFRATECPAGGCSPGTAAGLSVQVIQGRVAVTNASGTVEVPAGSAIHMADTRAPPVFTAGPNRRVAPPATPGSGSPGGNGGAGRGGGPARTPGPGSSLPGTLSPTAQFGPNLY
ncbi:MAG TPA: FecR family protein [Burkholderiaceae bacterium]|nr:FecR family protein [Burkholderiaceae bacterium]